LFKAGLTPGTISKSLLRHAARGQPVINAQAIADVVQRAHAEVLQD
jgi:hypothetical protein